MFSSPSTVRGSDTTPFTPVADGLIVGSAVVRRIADGSAPVVLDVRSDAEFRAGHIPGAVHIPHDELAGRIDELQKQLALQSQF